MEVVYWLVAIVIFLIIEMISLGLTTIWFAGGAVVALIASVIGAPLWFQIVLFLVVSILLLIFTRPWALRYLNNRTIKTNSESLIGKKVMVIETIDNRKSTGKVRIGDLEWTARSLQDDLIIEENQMVFIKEITGVKVFVSPIEEKA